MLSSYGLQVNEYVSSFLYYVVVDEINGNADVYWGGVLDIASRNTITRFFIHYFVSI